MIYAMVEGAVASSFLISNYIYLITCISHKFIFPSHALEYGVRHSAVGYNTVYNIYIIILGSNTINDNDEAQSSHQ